MPSFSHAVMVVVTTFVVTGTLGQNGVIAPGDTFPGFVNRSGFPVEHHTAVTPDGFVLTLFRLPAPKPNAPVVLLQHGILASMWCWVAHANPDKAVAFRLWREGYDVWLSNSRGNTYSRNSTQHKVDSDAFWDWTYEDMAARDVPTNVDYVLNHTAASSLSFAGWSQGNTQFMMAALSERSLARKVNVYSGISPVVYLTHSTSLLIDALARFNVGGVIYAVDKRGFLDGSVPLHTLESILCKLTFGTLCQITVAAVCGESSLDDALLIENVAAHFPAGTSVKDMLHYEQFIKHGNFARFDYGAKQNQARYGRPTPPLYNLSEWPRSIPLALFNAANDALVATADRERQLAELAAQSPSPIVFERVYSDFSHLTWFTGKDSAAPWLDDLVAVLARYNPVT